MDYLVKADIGSMLELSTVFNDVCDNLNVEMSTTKARLILLAFVEKAKEKGLFIPQE